LLSSCGFAEIERALRADRQISGSERLRGVAGLTELEV